MTSRSEQYPLVDFIIDSYKADESVPDSLSSEYLIQDAAATDNLSRRTSFQKIALFSAGAAYSFAIYADLASARLRRPLPATVSADDFRFLNDRQRKALSYLQVSVFQP
jgi:hypothetical protein